MKTRVLLALSLILSSFAGYVIAQRGRAAVSINNDIAWFSITGSRTGGEAAKRLTFVSLHYNDATVPCILVDTKSSALSNDLVGGAAISCGWTPEAIAAIGNASK